MKKTIHKYFGSAVLAAMVFGGVSAISPVSFAESAKPASSVSAAVSNSSVVKLKKEKTRDLYVSHSGVYLRESPTKGAKAKGAVLKQGTILKYTGNSAHQYIAKDNVYYRTYEVTIGKAKGWVDDRGVSDLQQGFTDSKFTVTHDDHLRPAPIESSNATLGFINPMDVLITTGRSAAVDMEIWYEVKKGKTVGWVKKDDKLVLAPYIGKTKANVKYKVTKEHESKIGPGTNYKKRGVAKVGYPVYSTGKVSRDKQNRLWIEVRVAPGSKTTVWLQQSYLKKA